MALFKLLRGNETSLSTTIVDGQVYFCKDTNNFYIDCGTTRYKIAAKYADKLRYVADGQTVEIDPATILTDSNFATKIGAASASKAGLMSKEDKAKLDGISEGANKITVDEALSATSTNPVQNKAVQAALDQKAGLDVATESANGLMSAADKAKLDDIAEGAEVNQNAYSKVTVGTTEIVADAKTDNITVVAGDNITLTPDASKKQYTITAKDTTYVAATASADGLMSKADKEKLDGIATGANKYELPTASETELGGIKVGANLSIDGNGVLSATDTTYENATTGKAGLMSGADKTKLDGIAEGATRVLVDTTLDAASANPVENKAVKAALDGKSDVGHTHDYIPTAEKGAANGVATLDENGLVPSTQLPSYVDDVVEVANFDALPATGESGKIYVTLNDNLTYRWGGTAYVEISKSLAIGTTANTAAAGNHGHAAATTEANGFMSAADKEKLDGIAMGANAYTLPAATADELGGIKVGKNLTVSGDGTLDATDTTYETATTSADGLMSKSDKSKLDGIAEGANKTIVDATLSDSSTNPVQNKVVKAAIDAKADEGHEHTEYENQNAFSIVKVGATNIEAGTATDTVEIEAGANVTITPDAGAGKIVIAATDTTYENASTSAAGLMSAADKTKLDGIATGATKVIVDSALTSTSENPVQSKAIYEQLSWVEF